MLEGKSKEAKKLLIALPNGFLNYGVFLFFILFLILLIILNEIYFLNRTFLEIIWDTIRS